MDELNPRLTVSERTGKDEQTPAHVDIEPIVELPAAEPTHQNGTICLSLDPPNAQAISQALLQTSVSALPLHPSEISNVVGPVLEVSKVNDDEAEVQLVYGFRAKFNCGRAGANAERANSFRRHKGLPGDADEGRSQTAKFKRSVSLKHMETPGLHLSSVDVVDGPLAGLKDAVVPRGPTALQFNRISISQWQLNPEHIFLGRRLAVGGFAEVYVGKYQGTVVAVKVLFNENTATLDQFQREVEMLCSLRHPNLILFMGYCTSPRLAIISEYMARGSLFNILRKRAGQPLEDKLQRLVCVSVARGMAFLHSLRPPVLHMDLKSPNILLDERWRVKITDFGLSRLRHSTFVSSGQAGGTPEWMAPEMLRGEGVTEAVDVYSYGVVVWELITCQAPWENLNPMQVVGAVGYGGQSLPLPTEGDPLLISLCAACSSPDPKSRPSFAEIVDMFDRVFGQEVKQGSLTLSRSFRTPSTSALGAPQARPALQLKFQTDDSGASTPVYPDPTAAAKSPFQAQPHESSRSPSAPPQRIECATCQQPEGLRRAKTDPCGVRVDGKSMDTTLVTPGVQAGGVTAGVATSEQPSSRLPTSQASSDSTARCTSPVSSSTQRSSSSSAVPSRAPTPQHGMDRAPMLAHAPAPAVTTATGEQLSVASTSGPVAAEDGRQVLLHPRAAGHSEGRSEGTAGWDANETLTGTERGGSGSGSLLHPAGDAGRAVECTTVAEGGAGLRSGSTGLADASSVSRCHPPQRSDSSNGVPWQPPGSISRLSPFAHAASDAAPQVPCSLESELPPFAQWNHSIDETTGQASVSISQASPFVALAHQNNSSDPCVPVSILQPSVGSRWNFPAVAPRSSH